MLWAGVLPCNTRAQAASGGPTDRAADIYLDRTARRLIEGVRAARDAQRSSVLSYTALVREQLAFASPGWARDRPLVNAEYAARVRWSRNEPDIIHVLGSRLRHPVLIPGGAQPFFGGTAARHATDPLRDPFHFALDYPFNTAGEFDAMRRSPLGPDAGRHYQFRSGDTIVVALSSGDSVQAVLVTAIPRWRDIRLLAAMLWVDAESYGVVRAAYRMAKKVDSETRWTVRGQEGGWDLGVMVDFPGAEDVGKRRARQRPPEEADEPPDQPEAGSAAQDHPGRIGLFGRLMNSVVDNWAGPADIDLSTVVVEYTLWELEHWLPRKVTRVGYVRVGSEPGPGEDRALVMPAFHGWTFDLESVRTADSRGGGAPASSSADVLAAWRTDSDYVEGDGASQNPEDIIVIIPRDRRSLEESEWLPPPAWGGAGGGAWGAEAREIGADLAEIGVRDAPDPAGGPGRWAFHPPIWTLRLLRSNPVEGLSAGTRLQWKSWWGSVVATVRVGTRRIEPDVELTAERDHPRRRLRLSVYRSLRKAALDREGLGILRGEVGGGEVSDYYVASGAALRLLPPAGERAWMSVRLFAERHNEPESGYGTARWGATMRLRPWWGGYASHAVNGGGDLSLEGWLGDHESVRAAVTGALVVPLERYWSAALEGSVAYIWGDPEAHDLWSLGGDGTWLRGYPARSLAGSTVQRGRAELRRPLRFLRLALFGDWASDGRHHLYSVGSGLMFMNGLMRVDLARGLSSRPDLVDGGEPLAPGWRLHLRGDAFF